MVEPRDVHRSLDLALGVGEVLLVSGAGAADVSTAMIEVAHASGLDGVTADVTFNDLTLRHQPTAEDPVFLAVRRVSPHPIDYALLIEVDAVIDDLTSARVTRDQAQRRLTRALSTNHARRRWAVALGWGVMGVGIALTFGGSPLVCLLAFLAASAIYGTQQLLPGTRIPPFYQQAAGGLVATLIAVLAASTSLEVNPSRVVTAGIVMLLAGVGLTGASQDALTGFPVTATARLLDALLNTTGIIAGVGAGLTLGGLLDVELGTFKHGAVGLAAAGVTVVGAAIGAAGFAYASYAPLRALAAVAMVGAAGQAILLTVLGTGLNRTWGAAAAATVIGGVCYVVARVFRLPPLIVVAPAIVPLLPGLDIYRGLALFANGQDGVLPLASAFTTALGLAAGVILGQYVAQPLRREVHRLEPLIPAPLMVGPFRRRMDARHAPDEHQP